ncbi:hypothetical protein DesfrDRAFT_1384 [Solidesulfovibrio fructosivorans JJ]]|uniref:Uncharacterized protein n=1 Tax=Solidesulfovibrio fructosivorans JJ] TaxID=596151 RepID=E1JUT5_SOLFR|nr:hypothetical protein [Solidesulfovibrio fructosivorans]EFL51849.1 hypothetical protein DesfrDRAFT_1384 [Solidesulfovibrio fructosivorans JJ]]
MAANALSRVRSRGNPTPLPGFQGKRQTPLLAIQTFCRSCMGGNSLLVGACASTTCKLHAYRCGSIATGADRRLLRIIKSYCAESCLPLEDAATCVAGMDYLDHPACPLWPYRQGRNPFYSEVAREKRRLQALERGLGQGCDGISSVRTDESDRTHSCGHPVAKASLLTLIPRPVSPATEAASTLDQMEVRHA